MCEGTLYSHLVSVAFVCRPSIRANERADGETLGCLLGKKRGSERQLTPASTQTPQGATECFSSTLFHLASVSCKYIK